MTKLLIVESPNKVKSIRKILGNDWQVAATAGHIMDLPRSSLGIDLKSFALRYEYIPERKAGGRTFPGGKARVDKIRPMARDAEAVYIATDPDREGEAIAAHVKRALALSDSQCHRVRFNAIDRATIEKGLNNAGTIDTALVTAQGARRALDRLVGYSVSPLMSRALDARVSAGRVQSPALRYVVERERSIRNFRSTRHYTAVLKFDGGAWQAEWDTADYLAEGEDYILDPALAERAASVTSVTVERTETKQQKEAPPAPFTTSTLLQTASTALGLNPEQTAQMAQKLFEGGHISYHRTDGAAFSDEALSQLRARLKRDDAAMTDAPRVFSSGADAQDGHEPIRPKDFNVETLAGTEDAALDGLYQLIRNRALASQMPDAVFRINASTFIGEAGGQTFRFKARSKSPIEQGWRVMRGRSGDNEAQSDQTGGLPYLSEGKEKRVDEGRVVTRDTQPPKRYTKASLIKKLEAGGVGRPSTFANIISTIEKRGYVVEKKKKLEATELGERLIAELLRVGFSFADPRFTKTMEDNLDHIAAGKGGYAELLRTHYDRLDQEAADHGGLAAAAPQGPPTDENGDPYPCPKCGEPLMRRQIRRGERAGQHFWSCSAWKQTGCKGAMDDKDGVPVAREPAGPAKDAEGNTHACPECGSPLARREVKKGPRAGQHFWACTAWRETGCKGAMDDKDGVPVAREAPKPATDDHGRPYPCPDCGSPLIRRAVKKGPRKGSHFWSCSAWKDTGCKGAMDDNDGVPAPRQSLEAREGFSIKPD